MSEKCIFITGGARSGKSHLAQNMANSLSKKVLFVATAEPLDTDMQERIKKHRLDRPQTWHTLEAPSNLASKISKYNGNAQVILIDCMTLLVSNILLGNGRGFSEDKIDTQEVQIRVAAEIQSLIELIENSDSIFIIVSNEVGSGIVPENRFARIYRDVLGKANQLIAEHADEVYLVISGIPVKVKPSER